MDANNFFQVTLTIIGGLLTAILSILAYFIKKWIESVDKLASEFSILREDFVKQRSDYNGFDERCKMHHSNIGKALEDIQEQVADNTHKIEQNSLAIELLKQKKRG